jgi:hypothetical protein
MQDKPNPDKYLLRFRDFKEQRRISLTDKHTLSNMITDIFKKSFIKNKFFWITKI